MAQARKKSPKKTAAKLKGRAKAKSATASAMTGKPKSKRAKSGGKKAEGSIARETRLIREFEVVRDRQAGGAQPQVSMSMTHYPIPNSLFGITPRAEELIADGLNNGRARQVRALTQMLHPAEQADLAERLDRTQRRRLYRILGPDLNTEILRYLHADARDDAFSLIGATEMAQNSRPEFQTDDALALLEQLEPVIAEQHDEDIPLGDPDDMAASKKKDYAPDTIGAVMFRNAIVLPADWTAGHAIDFLRSADAKLPPEFYSIFVQDEGAKKVGQAMLSRIVSAPRSTRLEDIMKDLPYRIPATMKKDEVALLFKRFHIVSAPIVDEKGSIISVVTFDDVVDVIEEEAAAELLRLNKVTAAKKGESFFVTLRGRFIWLFVNLGTAILAASVIGLFDKTIEQLVALAVLFPIVASMGGNAGTQTVTVAVRGLATREISLGNMMQFIGKEGAMGLLNGAAFAVICAGIALLWFGDIPLALTMMAAMIINMVAAGVCGALIPLGLQRMGTDPAIASSVFITTVTDVVGFFAFLGIATVFLL